MAHDRSVIATIDGAEEQRVEVRGPGYVWAAAVAAVVAALLLVALAAAGAVDFLRRDGRQDQTALALQGESASTSSDSLDTFMEDGLVVDGEGGRRGRMGAEHTPPARWQSFWSRPSRWWCCCLPLRVWRCCCSPQPCGPQCGAGGPSRDDNLESAARDTSR